MVYQTEDFPGDEDEVFDSGRMRGRRGMFLRGGLFIMPRTQVYTSPGILLRNRGSLDRRQTDRAVAESPSHTSVPLSPGPSTSNPLSPRITTMASDAPTTSEIPSASAAAPSAAAAAAPTSLPANAFDFLPDLHALLQRVSNDELDPKDVAHESSRIRLKMERARVMVSELPGVDRSLEEQKKEIRELEEKIERQRGIMTAVSRMEVVTEVVQRRGGEKMEMDS